jgi:transcriptional regulator with XRE-family HTH domain
MLQQQPSYRNAMAPLFPIHLGAFLKMLRDRHGIAQAEVLKYLPGWQQPAYSKVEKDTRAPTFDQLLPIYNALAQAGVQLTLQDRQHFVLLARRKIESMKTRHERKSDADWEELLLELAGIDRLPVEGRGQEPARLPHALRRRIAESRHLVGREEWLLGVITSLQGPLPKKLVIVQGPVGIGKSSELHRLANHVLRGTPSSNVVLCELPSLQEGMEPDMALEMLLSDILEAVGPHLASLPTTSLQARVKYVLDLLAREGRPTVFFLDNAEHVLDERGSLSPVWQRFLAKFVRAHHDASLILATREWPASFMEEAQLVMRTTIPPLSTQEGYELLERLGLQDVPQGQLERAVQAVSGIPLCLEWVARLVQEPLLRNNWSAFEEDEEREAKTQRLTRLLEDSSLFGGSIAARLQPLLERVIKRLSPEGHAALLELACSPVPLAGPALRALYRDPAPLQELGDASLLVTYPRRVQLLPMVAAQVRLPQSSQQVAVAEERLIGALSCWLDRGVADIGEQAGVFTGLACLLLRRKHLLAAAELVLYHGWLAAQVGQMLRLARLVPQVLNERPWHQPSETEAETECGSILLQYYLAPYLGTSIDGGERAEAYELIRAHIAAGRVKVEPLMEVHLMEQIMLSYLNEERFEEAELLLEECFSRLKPLCSGDAELQATLQSKRAVLLSRRSGYAQSQGRIEEARQLREQAIAAYERCLSHLEVAEREVGRCTLRESTLKKKRATFLNNLAYQFNTVGRYEEALGAIDRCLELKEQGYAERDSLAATIGEKSQTLAALGQLQEALRLDERACEEIGRLAAAGDTMSQEEQWIYQVNRARLYLLLARVDEAERLLQEAEPRIHPRRSVYKTLAKTLLDEIRQWRAASRNSGYQLDWRWVERYRELSAYDAYWWWAHAGPFTEEEEQRWNRIFSRPVDERTKDQLRGILVHSRDRELAEAEALRREPRLRYPTIEIEAVRQRIADFLALEAEVSRYEPNAIVRRLYRGAIADEICFLRMIEATHEGNCERFWELTQQLHPPPTVEEMEYALARVKDVVAQGLQGNDTFEVSQRVIRVWQERTGFLLDLPSGIEEVQSRQECHPVTSYASPHMISAQAAKRFFEALLRDSGYEDWQVVLDQNASGPRVEAGLRQLFLQDSSTSLSDIREYVSHELLGHVTRSVAGEYSPLGLLGMGTQGYLPTEEGFADYHERRLAALHGQPFDDSGSWLGTLAVGLASGVVTPPQTFSSLFAFFEPFLLLYRLLWRDDEDRATAEQRARKNALMRCLRTYRGVTDLQRPGICFTKDVVYLRGLLAIERAVASDETVLDRLAVGKVALELLPELQELGIVAPQQVSSLRKLAYDTELDDYILSFEKEADRVPSDTL